MQSGLWLSAGLRANATGGVEPPPSAAGAWAGPWCTAWALAAHRLASWRGALLLGAAVCAVVAQPRLVAAAPEAPNEVLRAGRLATAIVVDGQLEAAWSDAAGFAVSHEFAPLDGRAAPVATEGYVGLTDDALLVAFVCHEPDPAALRATLTERDRMYADDFVGIVLDTYQDHRQAYEFFSNPHGVQGDAMWHADRAQDDDEDVLWQANGGDDLSFDAVWEAAGRVEADRWVVEMRIPFSALRFPDQARQRWSVHLVRVYPREYRYQLTWRPISRDSNSFMAQSGALALDLSAGRRTGGGLQLLPYLVASRTDRLVDDGAGGSSWRNQDDGSLGASQRVGVTGQYALDSDHLLDFAVRPDFSQIESDEGRLDVNTPFALFYSERRPFFMEGKDVFLVDYVASGMVLDVANLIYTRSINDPRLAAKLTGRDGRLTYGAISAWDINSPLVLPLADGTIVRRTTADSWSNIARLKCRIADESHVGLTATSRRLSLGGGNSAAGLESVLRLSDDYTLTAFGALTYTDEPDDDALSAGIPDVTFEASGKTITADLDGQRFLGHVLKATLLRQSRGLNLNLSLQDYSPGFRADNSAIFSNDGRLAHALGRYDLLLGDHPLVTRVSPGLYVWRKIDYDGRLKDTGLRPEVNLALARQTTLNLGGFLFNRERFHDVEFDDARTLWMSASTRPSEHWAAWVYLNRGRSINRFGEPGSAHNPLALVPTLDVNSGLSLQPTDRLANEIQLNTIRLTRASGGELVVRQLILRDGLRFQYSRWLLLRLVAELNHVRRAVAADRYQSDTALALEPLFSYKLNPFTVCYLGANLDSQEDPYPDRTGLTWTAQTVYVKLQYLWQGSRGAGDGR